MALEFPANPSDGDIYDAFTWSASVGAWRASDLPQQVVVASATPPSNPQVGALWFNTNDGSNYVYFNDGTGTQWVQVKSDATLSSTLSGRVTALEGVTVGLVPIVPASISVSSGTGSIASSGVVTLSGVGTLNINNCFTTTYDNYRIIWRGGSDGNSGVGFRFRSGVTTESGSVYGFSGAWYGSRGSSSNVAATATLIGGIFGHNTHSWSGDVTGPMVSSATAIQGLGFAWATSDGATEMHIDGGMIKNTTQYDGLTVFNPSAGTLTGKFAIYGYRN